MTEWERIRRIKRAAQAWLLSIPGVHAVAIGPKTIGGRVTSTPAILVSVTKKKTDIELPEFLRIPAEIDGVKTDVVESEVPRIAEDNKPYDEITGGIQIAFSSGDHVEGGTLGCIGRTDEPEPRIVALTCHHVVASFNAPQPASLTVTPTPGPPTTVTVSGTSSPDSLIRVSVSPIADGDQKSKTYNVFYVPEDGDSPTTIAINIAGQMNSIAQPAVSAAGDISGVITLTAGPGFSLRSFSCDAYGSHPTDQRATLHASIIAPTLLQDPMIALRGVASGDGFASVNINPGGMSPTLGFFVEIKNGDTANSIAQAIVAAVNNHPVSFPGITALYNNGQVTMKGAQEVECDVFADARVGQPDATFPSACSRCLDRNRGRVINARVDLDAALVRLNPGTEYKAAIEGIGAVSGHYVIRPEDISQNGVPIAFPVRKRGRTTLLTDGTVTALDRTGFTDVPHQSFYRYYTNAIEIKPSSPGVKFSDEGDSGAAIVVTRTEPDNNGHMVERNYVAGILFATEKATGVALATPIDSIIDGLEFLLETADDPNEVRTVPAVTAHALASELKESSDLLTLARAQSQITATAAGKYYLELLQRHLPEAQALVNKNRRVAAIWQRNGGPEIVRSMVRMTESSEEALPTRVKDTPLPECLAAIEHIFARYGSPQLSSAMRKSAGSLASLAGLKFPQALEALREMRVE